MLLGIGCQVLLWIRDRGRWANKIKISFKYCKYLLDGKPQAGGYVNFYLHPIGGQGYEQRYFNSQEVEGRVPWSRPLLLFNQEVSSNSLQPHGLQYSRLPCPPLSPRACSNSCPLTQWCYPTISSSAALFSFCLQSSPASGSFPVNSFFTSDGQSVGVSASASVLPMNIQSWVPLGLTGLIFLVSKGLSVFSSTTDQKHQFFSTRPSLWSALTSIHDYWKNHSFHYTDLCQQSDVSAFS